MSLIKPYAHYYMTEDQITDLHKKEVWEAFLSVDQKFSKLSEVQQDWFKKYFPGVTHKCE